MPRNVAPHFASLSAALVWVLTVLFHVRSIPNSLSVVLTLVCGAVVVVTQALHINLKKEFQKGLNTFQLEQLRLNAALPSVLKPVATAVEATVDPLVTQAATAVESAAPTA